MFPYFMALLDRESNKGGIIALRSNISSFYCKVTSACDAVIMGSRDEFTFIIIIVVVVIISICHMTFT